VPRPPVHTTLLAPPNIPDLPVHPKSVNYQLQPVLLYWKPLRKLKSISDAISTLISSHFAPQSMELDNMHLNRQVSELASRVCCTKPLILARAILRALHAQVEPISLEWDSHLLSDSDMMQIISSGVIFEHMMVSFVVTCSQGLFASSAHQFVDTILSLLLHHIQHGKMFHEGEKTSNMSDFMASAFVRLYIKICLEFNLLLRARALIFDLLREKEEICVLQLLAGLFAWPMIVEASGDVPSRIDENSRQNGTLGPGNTAMRLGGGRSKSFVSCTIEAILTAAILSTQEASDVICQLEREHMQRILGWKVENRSNLLKRWSILVSNAFHAHLHSAAAASTGGSKQQTSSTSPTTLMPATKSFSASHFISMGIDLVQSLELLCVHLGWQFCVSNIMQPIIWPCLLSFPAQFAAEDASGSASSLAMLSLRASLLVKATGALSKIGLESDRSSPSPLGLLMNWLSHGTPIPFNIQLQAVQVIISAHLTQNPSSNVASDLSALYGWFVHLSPIQRRHIPPHLEPWLCI
jgi:hypothetical protein